MADQVTSVTLSDRDRENVEILTMLDLNPKITTMRQAISYALKFTVDSAPKRDVAFCRAEIQEHRKDVVA